MAVNQKDNCIHPHEYPASTLELARWLIGKKLIMRIPESASADNPPRVLSGLIIETEAYLADDAASHSFRGKTDRNSAMFLRAGHWYVYRSYGIHCCVNLVSSDPGQGEAVLIRSLFPLEGRAEMAANRGLPASTAGSSDERYAKKLCSGPGKLCQALGIGMELNGSPGWSSVPDSTSGLLLCNAAPHVLNIIDNLEIKQGKRIGITKNSDFPGRFYAPLKGYVSRL